jgi:zinc protease
METLDMADVLSFYDLYYSPNNAILVVAGDADPDEVRRLAEEHYGPIPAEDQPPPRFRPAEPPQLAERRLVYEDARVSQPYVTRSYLAPERDPGAQETAAALTYLAEILGGSSFTSLLGRKLTFDTQTALFTGAFYDGDTLDSGSFTVTVVPSEGVTLQEAEEAMDQVLTDFLASGVDPAQFDRIRTQLRAAEIYARDDVDGLARRYGAALAAGLTVQDVQDWPDILQAVTPDDVLAAAQALFDRRQSVTMWVVPDRESL